MKYRAVTDGREVTSSQQVSHQLQDLKFETSQSGGWFISLSLLSQYFLHTLAVEGTIVGPGAAGFCTEYVCCHA